MLAILKGDYTKYNRKELSTIKVEKPAIGGDRWRGIQHGDLVNGLIETVSELFGAVPLPESEVYAVSPSGAAMIGGFSLATIPPRSKKPKALLLPGTKQDTYKSIGFQHSNDCRKALTVYCGGTVRLCTNGLVSAAHTFRHKHTTGLSLRDWMREGLEVVWENFDQTGLQIAALADCHIRPLQHDRLLLELGREDIIPWRMLGEVDESWKHAQAGEIDWSPEGDWGFDDTVWDWYNCVTHTAKKMPPAVQFNSLERAFHLAYDALPRKARPSLN